MHSKCSLCNNTLLSAGNIFVSCFGYLALGFIVGKYAATTLGLITP